MFRRLSPSETRFKAPATSKRKDNSPQAIQPWTHRCHLLYSLVKAQVAPDVPHKQVSECWPEFFFAPRPSTTTAKSTDRLPRPHPAAVASRPFHHRISGGLITDSPMSIYCSHGNLPRFSLLRVSSPSRIIATTTKICTRYTVACRLTPYTSSRAPRPPTHP